MCERVWTPPRHLVDRSLKGVQLVISDAYRGLVEWSRISCRRRATNAAWCNLPQRPQPRPFDRGSRGRGQQRRPFEFRRPRISLEQGGTAGSPHGWRDSLMFAGLISHWFASKSSVRSYVLSQNFSALYQSVGSSNRTRPRFQALA
jgi:hypothetical protein